MFQNWKMHYNTLFTFSTELKFKTTHWKNVSPHSNRHADGWGGCECEVDGKCISRYSLPG